MTAPYRPAWFERGGKIDAIVDVEENVLSAAAGIPPSSDLASTNALKGAALVGYDGAYATVKLALDAIVPALGLETSDTASFEVKRCRAVTSANMASFTGVSTTLDGLTLVAGNRVLVKAQSTPAQNGIYVVGTVTTGTAPWTRATDMAAASTAVNGMLFVVDAGTLGANTIHKLTNAGTITVATTGLTFETIPTSTQLPTLIPGKVTSVVGVEGAVTADTIEIACTVKDCNGTVITTQPEILVKTIAATANKGDLAAANVAVGTAGVTVNPATGANYMAIVPTVGGLFSFAVLDDQVESVIVEITGEGIRPSVQVITFA